MEGRFRKLSGPHRAVSSGRSVLVDTLAARIGAARAEVVVSDALVRSGRHTIPDLPDDLLAFARAHLIDDLVSAIGAREVPRFLDDLRESARLLSGIRTREVAADTRTVALVDRDLFRRATVARLLIARRFAVVVAAALEELTAPGVTADVLILDQEAALSAALYIVLSQPGFRPGVVLRTRDNPVSALRILERAGVETFEIVATTAPSELVAAVERVLDRGE